MDKKDENSPSNLWTRRSKYVSEPKVNAATHPLTTYASTSNSKLSLSVNKNSHSDEHSTPSAKRFGSQSGHSKNNPFSAPLSSAAVASPTGAGASSAFGLGSGAFASFGSGGKTPKTPGSAFDFGGKSSGGGAEKKADSASEKDGSDNNGTQRRPPARKSLSSIRPTPTTESAPGSAKDGSTPWPLKNSWIIHYRPPTGKNSDYEKSIQPVCRISTAQEFWKAYAHLRHPSVLPTVSDYHIFKEGIRPVWEDEENKKGGKWTMRLKKGVADRYWEELLLAMIGDQFAEASEEVCGAVVSVRVNEDVFSIWTKNDGGRNVKIRETIKRVLQLPSDTNLVFRSHDESIVQRDTADRVRQEKSSQLHSEKRRNTLNATANAERRDDV